MIGMIPGTILFAFLGNELWHPTSPRFILALLLIGVSFAAGEVYRRMRVDRSPGVNGAASATNSSGKRRNRASFSARNLSMKTPPTRQKRTARGSVISATWVRCRFPRRSGNASAPAESESILIPIEASFSVATSFRFASERRGPSPRGCLPVAAHREASAWVAKLMSITCAGWPSAHARFTRRPCPSR